MAKVVDIQVHADDVRAFMAEFMGFAYKLEEQMVDHSDLEYLNGCPVSKEMLGTTLLTITENLLHMHAIDQSILMGIVSNITETLKMPKGPTRSTVLM